METIVEKTALVTGANRGIGKAIVETLINHGIGKVYATARNISSLETLIEAYPDKVFPLKLDVTDPVTIAAAVELSRDVDIVINNAGILEVSSALNPDAIKTFAKELDVNVYGLLRMAQAYAPVLKANGGGAFVQLNSVLSMLSFPDFATYAASKAAAYSFTIALRAQLSEQGTQLVSVHPGPIATDMSVKAGFEEIAEPPELVGESIIEALLNNDFHAFPDKMAKDIEQAYAGFAENVILAAPTE